jgi:hypothetical protein
VEKGASTFIVSTTGTSFPRFKTDLFLSNSNEFFFLEKLKPQLLPHINANQFAYQPKIVQQTQLFLPLMILLSFLITSRTKL